MAPIYSSITYGQAKQELANRLYDSTKQFWSDAELGLYLIESLRTWNALTAFWRNDFTFPSQPGVTWYDLTDSTNLPNTLRPYTVLTPDLYTLIQYHLLEPPTGLLPWIGSTQFSLANLQAAVQRRTEEVIGVTACTQARVTVPAVAGRIVIPGNTTPPLSSQDAIIDVRRVAYLPAIGSPSTLWPEDVWAEQAFAPHYLQQPAGTPLTYMLSTQPPLSFDTDRPPGSAGSYELLVTLCATSLSDPRTLNIPDDWTHIIKWGALADLLSYESNAKDSLRAQYCEQRYRMGLQLLAAAPALLQMRSNNVPLQIDAVRSADLYNAAWQAASPGPPATCLQAGLNLIALSPTQNAGPYSLTATVVQNAPLPVVNGDFLQAAHDELEAIMNYAQHLASFKLGGSEFLSTMPLLERFLGQASVFGLRLAEIAEYTSVLYALSHLEDAMNPRSTSPPETSNG
jgi:hypothetical protein